MLLDRNILVNQESNRHWIQLTIPSMDRRANTWSFHLYHRGIQFFSSVSYGCIILFHTVTAQKELWDWADPSSQDNAEGLYKIKQLVDHDEGGGYYEGASLHAFHPYPFYSFFYLDTLE